MKNYKKLAQTIAARNNCLKRDDDSAETWAGKHQDTIDDIMKNAPSGSGFDSGTTIINSHIDNNLIFKTSFHHMNDGGYYDGWTEHIVKVLPDLQFDFILKISGKNRNDIKNYIYSEFEQWLNSEYTEYTE